jgi:hypothetical protein
LFVSNPTEFQNSYGITLPSNGLYLADCEWDIPGSTSNDINVTKLLINEQRKIDSKYLDLDTSELSKVAFSGDYNDLTNTPDIVYPVTSVAGKTGVVTLAKEDVDLGNVDNVKQYSASNPPPYPVSSVAGKTGAVTLAKDDVGLDNVDNVK